MEKENKLREEKLERLIELAKCGLWHNYPDAYFNKKEHDEFKEIVESTRLYHQKEPVELDELRVKFNKAMVSGELQGRPSMSDIFNWFAPHLHQKAEQNDAVEFAEWITNNCQFSNSLPTNQWYYVDENSDRHRMNTKQLYDLYLTDSKNNK